MTTLKRWISSPWFKDTSERAVRAYAAAGVLVLTAHNTGAINLAWWKSVLLAGVVPVVSVVFSALSTMRSAPTESPASLVAAQPQMTRFTATVLGGITRTYGDDGWSTYRRRIHEHKVAGKPLGRHVHYDSRSLNFLVQADGTVASARWDRQIPVLDQGQVGSCTGNAATGALGTSPDYDAIKSLLAAGLNLDEAEALNLYSAAETIDGDGPYPPNDNGSSGLSVAKAALAAGLISAYKHITSLAAAQTEIQTGPFIVGSNWFTGMDTPSANGVVTATGTVRGGHEYECIGYDATQDLWEFVNSWGTSYGVAGHFFYSSATFSKLLAEDGDATVLLPLAVPSPQPGPTPTPTPVPVATDVLVDDPGLVAKIDELAVKAKLSPHDYLAARLRSLWKVS